jgi:hypothetical protein
MDAAILIRDMEPFRQARPVWDRGGNDLAGGSERRDIGHSGSHATASRRAQSRRLVEELM